MPEPDVIEEHRNLLQQAREARGHSDACLDAVLAARERLAQLQRADLLADGRIRTAAAVVARDSHTDGDRLLETAAHAGHLGAAIGATVEVLLVRSALEDLKGLLSGHDAIEAPDVFADGVTGSEAVVQSLMERADSAMSAAIEAALADDLRIGASAVQVAAEAERLTLEAAEAGVRERQAHLSTLEARVRKAQESLFAGPGCLVAIISAFVIVPIAQLMNAGILTLLPVGLGFAAARIIKSIRLESARRACSAEKDLHDQLTAFVAERRRVMQQRGAGRQR